MTRGSRIDRRWPAILAVAFAISATPAFAQNRPFVFSVMTSSSGEAQARVDYDVGVGEQAFHGATDNGPEQRIGIQASWGRWSFIGRVGRASSGSSNDYETSQQGEVLYSLRSPTALGFSLGAGGGVLHEAAGGDVLLVRAVAGHEARTWRALSNLLVQKPLMANRDAVDLITSAGWARKVTPALSLGAEMIGEDLEGFWEPAEAEGGARLLAGPALHVAPPGRPWQVSLVGGPAVHSSSSTRLSVALRDLPSTQAPLSYAVKLSFSASF